MDLNKIYELSAGIDYHLKCLTSFMDQLREIKTSLDEIKNAQERQYSLELAAVKEQVDIISTQLRLRGLPEVNLYERQLEQARGTLETGEWPDAVDPDSICMSNDEKQQARATGILDIFIAEFFKDKKFLDYGCGLGHVPVKAREREAKLSVGYDVNHTWKFESEADLIFTSNFAEVKKHAPYDTILLHDVLDHCVIDPVEALRQAKSVLARKGKIYVRNHPWCARHGGHLYNQKNKAFLHLIFDDVELMRMGYRLEEHVIKIFRSLDTYRFWFQEAGLEVKLETPIRQSVENIFFENPFLRSKLLCLEPDMDQLKQNMELTFVEYILESNSDHQIL